MFSFGLDVVDGAIARYLNQSKFNRNLQLISLASRFGAALDLLVDK